jgi:AcrR family transcriptional regulator
MTQRDRMLEAIVVTVAERGFADATVADVVARAGVSRRTFYEHFDDKLDCFLAAYESRSDSVIREIERRVLELGSGVGWRARVSAGLEAYVERLASEPMFARVFNIDVLGAGPRALELREQVLGRFVATYKGLGADEELLRALVGGIAELVQARLLAGDAASLPELLPTLERLAFAVVGAGDRGEAWVA